MTTWLHHCLNSFTHLTYQHFFFYSPLKTHSNRKHMASFGPVSQSSRRRKKNQKCQQNSLSKEFYGAAELSPLVKQTILSAEKMTCPHLWATPQFRFWFCHLNLRSLRSDDTFGCGKKKTHEKCIADSSLVARKSGQTGEKNEPTK